MFRTERQDAILDELSREGRVTTSELAERYQVSEDSIRKDLQRLAADGRLRRVYGGAVSVGDAPKRAVTSRVDDYRPQKVDIARKAYELIEDGQTIFLDISSTNLYLADLLAKGSKRVIVVSNMLDLLRRASEGDNVEVQCPGGKVNMELNGLVGAVTRGMLERVSFDLAFIGALSVNVKDDAVTTFDMEDGAIKQTVLKAAERSYLVTDSHKFRARGTYRYARLSDFTGIITDEDNAAHRKAAAALGVEVL